MRSSIATAISVISICLFVGKVTSDYCDTRLFGRKDMVTINHNTIENFLNRQVTTYYETFVTESIYTATMENSNEATINRLQACLRNCPALILYTDSCPIYKLVNDPNDSNLKVYNNGKFYITLNVPLKRRDPRQPPITYDGTMKTIVDNMNDCLSSDTPNSNHRENMSGILRGIETAGIRALYKATYTVIPSGGVLSVGSVIMNTSYGSTAIDPEATLPYFRKEMNLYVLYTSQANSERIPIRGRQIEGCSLMPSDVEFLLAPDQCWEVVEIVEYSKSPGSYKPNRNAIADIRRHVDQFYVENLARNIQRRNLSKDKKASPPRLLPRYGQTGPTQHVSNTNAEQINIETGSPNKFQDLPGKNFYVESNAKKMTTDLHTKEGGFSKTPMKIKPQQIDVKEENEEIKEDASVHDPKYERFYEDRPKEALPYINKVVYMKVTKCHVDDEETELKEILSKF